jgi:hypothetical protein
MAWDKPMTEWKPTPRELLGWSLVVFFGSPAMFLVVALTSDHVPLKAYVVLFLGPVAGVLGFVRSLTLPEPAPTGPCSYCTLSIKPGQRRVCGACRLVVHEECREGHERVYHADSGPRDPKEPSAYRD